MGLGAFACVEGTRVWVLGRCNVLGFAPAMAEAVVLAFLAFDQFVEGNLILGPAFGELDQAYW